MQQIDTERGVWYFKRADTGISSLNLKVVVELPEITSCLKLHWNCGSNRMPCTILKHILCSGVETKTMTPFKNAKEATPNMHTLKCLESPQPPTIAQVGSNASFSFSNLEINRSDLKLQVHVFYSCNTTQVKNISRSPRSLDVVALLIIAQSVSPQKAEP